MVMQRVDGTARGASSAEKQAAQALKVKVGIKLASTIFAASTVCHGSRLGNSSGKRVLFPECSSRWIRSSSPHAFPIWISAGELHGQRGAG